MYTYFYLVYLIRSSFTVEFTCVIAHSYPFIRLELQVLTASADCRSCVQVIRERHGMFAPAISLLTSNRSLTKQLHLQVTEKEKKKELTLHISNFKLFLKRNVKCILIFI